MPTKSLLGIALVAGALGLPLPLTASTLEVDRMDDNAGATACTAAPNDCSLRGAILASNTAVGADTIHVPAGTYLLAIAGKDEDAAATGDLDITDSLTLTGADARTTIVNANDLDRVIDVYAPAVVEISNVTIRDGRGAVEGGGIFNAGELALRNCIVTSNEATADLGFSVSTGGGIASLGDLAIISTTVSDNTADGGGGVANADIGSLVVSNSSTISGNHAIGPFVGYGGGIVSAATISILDSTISNNTATDTAGGVGVPGPSTFTNTIIAGNSPNNCDNPVTSNGNNMDDDGSCLFFAAGDQSNVANAGLAPLQNYGGQTKTHALCTGAGSPHASCAAASPAIDTGAGCLATDQRGFARPQGGGCDIGAYEVGSTPPPSPDHFKCYQAKDLNDPKFTPASVSLSDQFGVNDGTFEVQKPFLLCPPVDKNGEGITNLVDHLVCYKIKGPALDPNARPTIQVSNQFGDHRLQPKKPFLLCVPSTKTLLP